MTKPAITNRVTKGAALTYSELDTNFSNLQNATISVTDGTNSHAFNLNDTITFTAGTNVTLSVNSSTGAITINSAASGGTITAGHGGRIPMYYGSAGSTTTTIEESTLSTTTTGLTWNGTGSNGNFQINVSSGYDVVLADAATGRADLTCGSINVTGISSSGNLSVTGDSNTVGTIKNYGKQAVNGPAFRAYPATAQTITSGSLQKCNFGSESFDTNNNFASSRFTPTVEGYYQLNSTVRFDGSNGTGECMIVIYKNGSEYARGWNSEGTQFAANFWSMSVSDVAYANGSTDYFEIYVQQGSGASRTTTAYTNISFFSGCMIRGAV